MLEKRKTDYLFGIFAILFGRSNSALKFVKMIMVIQLIVKIQYILFTEGIGFLEMLKLNIQYMQIKLILLRL